MLSPGAKLKCQYRLSVKALLFCAHAYAKKFKHKLNYSKKNKDTG